MMVCGKRRVVAIPSCRGVVLLFGFIGVVMATANTYSSFTSKTMTTPTLHRGVPSLTWPIHNLLSTFSHRHQIPTLPYDNLHFVFHNEQNVAKEEPDHSTRELEIQPRHHDDDYVARCSSSLPFLLNKIRGGSDDFEEEDDEEEGDDFDDDDLFGFEDEDFDAASVDGDFAEDNALDSIMDTWSKTPPFTKAYLAATFCATAAGYITNNNEFPSVLLLDWKRVAQGQFWRPMTAFFNFGPFGLSYVLTIHFVWTYMATLERLSHDKPYDFWMMIIFAGTTMLAGYSLLKLSPRFLGHNLSTFLVYVWSRYHEGIEVNLFELFNIRAELLPWFFLAQTFLLEGEMPVLDLLGIVFGHIYHHCKTTNLLTTPRFVVDWYHNSKSSEGLRKLYQEISSDFEMQP